MGETLEFHGSFAKQGEFACKRLTLSEIEEFWPQMVLEIRKVHHVWDMWWTEEALQFQAQTGNMQVWVAGKPPDFQLVTMSQVLFYPAGPLFQVVLMFGSGVDEVLPVVVGTLEHFAQEHGCRYAEVIGRFGWEQKLSEHGFRRSATILTKPLGALRRH